MSEGTAVETERQVQGWIDAHVARLAPPLRESNRAAWDAATGGGEEAAERAARARAEVKRIYSDPDDFARVRAWDEGAAGGDPLTRRQLSLLRREFTANQLPVETIEDLVRRSSTLEQLFHTFRSTLDGERVTDNAIIDVLREEADEGRRREAWEASKQIGREIAEPLRELVRRRNAAARALGFENYYVMELWLQELDEERLFGILGEFEARTDEAFAAFRAELDERLAARHGVAPEALRPWHWEDPFSQVAPSVGGVGLDRVFADRDFVPIAAEFFRGLGLPVDDVLSRSDLYEREGKDQHAFCMDVDREGDVRVLCNLRPNEKWAGTLLHELGHAAYDVFLPRSLPFLLRQPSHTLSTESIAMYFGRLTRDPRWLREVMGAALSDTEAEDVRAQLRASMLVSARWILVMCHFERALYRDPDRADLNSLWWDLVERMQLVRRPDGRDEPDWAAKIHFTFSPVYYHNYLLGELMASQISAASRADVPADRSVAGQTSVGRFLRERIFNPGASLSWDDLLVEATGEGLSPRFFVEEFVER